MIWSRFTLAGYAAVLSTVAITLSIGSLIYTKRSYDLSVAKDQREIQDKVLAVDIRPRGASAASFAISIINRADLNITPLSLRVEHSVEVGELYLSSTQQSLDKLSSALDLKPMGTIAPKGNAKLEGILAGATDGKWDSLTPGLALQFTVHLRYADHQDTIEKIDIVKRILPPLTDRLHPTPDMFLTVIQDGSRKSS
jgi:hypothetical protein